MAKELIFLVDDDPHFLNLLATLIREKGFEVKAMTDGHECVENLHQDPSAVFLDLVMPSPSGMETLAMLKKRVKDLPVIMLTSINDVETAVQLIKQGAYDYLIKPIEETRLLTTLDKALEQRSLLKKIQYLQGELATRSDGIVGNSPAIKAVLERINKLKDTRAGVLIYGESGTGKELVARAIHASSPLADGPFIDINCGAIPESLQESELFGHKKGSFTGAVTDQTGKLQCADGGSLFLDEVPEMSLQTQVKLLRFLQDKCFTRIGEHKNVQVDTRVIAATNQDLKTLVEQNKFREDLYYRLAVFPIKVPPLRERREDIPLLCVHFMQKYRDELNKDIRSISPEAMQVLMDYRWPGNIRQLENAIYQAMIITNYDSIDYDCLPEEILESQETPAVTLTTDEASPPETGDIVPYHDMIRQTVRRALSLTQGNIPKAAQKLGISRSTFYRMLKKYDLH